MSEAQALIRALDLQPHPEGGWYRETWRADAPDGERASATAILFLLERGRSSHWHKVDAAELWLFHAGSPLLLRTAPGDDGPVRQTRLGPNVLAGEHPQWRVEPHEWQAAEADLGWTLVTASCRPPSTSPASPSPHPAGRQAVLSRHAGEGRHPGGA